MVMKLLLCLLLVLPFAHVGEVLAGENITVTLDGEAVEFEEGAEPFIDEEDRTQVSLRFISEDVGANVDWDGERRAAIIVLEDKKAEFIIGEEAYTVNGETREMDTAPRIVEERTFIPPRFVADTLGLDIDWVLETRTVALNTEVDDVAEKAFFEVDIEYPEEMDFDKEFEVTFSITNVGHEEGSRLISIREDTPEKSTEWTEQIALQPGETWSETKVYDGEARYYEFELATNDDLALAQIVEGEEKLHHHRESELINGAGRPPGVITSEYHEYFMYPGDEPQDQWLYGNIKIRVRESPIEHFDLRVSFSHHIFIRPEYEGTIPEELETIAAIFPDLDDTAVAEDTFSTDVEPKPPFPTWYYTNFIYAYADYSLGEVEDSNIFFFVNTWVEGLLELPEQEPQVEYDKGFSEPELQTPVLEVGAVWEYNVEEKELSKVEEWPDGAHVQ